jgi:mRNA interferase RelE/StbE
VNRRESWELRYDPRVRTYLEKLRSRAVVRRIEESAQRLQDHPELGKPLRRYEGIGLRSYRLGTPGGEYRILYQLRKSERVVFVILIGSREEVYKLLERRAR